MGWAGLSPKLLGRFRPKMDWADLDPKKLNLLFWARPGPEDRAGPGSAWPKPKTGGGNYFPPTPACRTLLVLHAEKEKKKINARMRGKKSYLARRRRRWLAAFLAVLWWRSVVVSLLTGGGSKQRRCCLKRRREGFFLFPSPLFPSLFFFFFGFLSPCFPFFRFSLLPLPFLSLSVFFPFSSPLLCFSRFFFSPSVPFSPLIAAVLAVIYRAKGVAFFSWGAAGWSAIGRDCQGSAPLGFLAGAWSASVFGRWAPGERGTGKKFKQKPLFPSSPLQCSGGKKKEEQCHSKRHRSALSFSFFLIKCMKRRRFGENAPFHLNVAPERANFQISPQSSFVHFNCIPAKISLRPYSWPRVSLWSLVSDFFN